jgi:hypothetical protein
VIVIITGIENSRDNWSFESDLNNSLTVVPGDTENRALADDNSIITKTCPLTLRVHFRPVANWYTTENGDEIQPKFNLSCKEKVSNLYS